MQKIFLQIIDLQKIHFSEFDYNHQNANDDFLQIAKKMTYSNPIILATPVYWYMPSTVMKKFIDRLSDLLIHEKDVGRKLKGKDLYLISSYHVHPEGKEGFEQIFKQICQYMSIKYKGCYFYYTGEDNKLKNQNLIKAEKFCRKLWELQEI